MEASCPTAAAQSFAAALGAVSTKMPGRGGPGTGRIIPVSKWLGSPPFISHLDHLWKGNNPIFRGLMITNVINQVFSLPNNEGKMLKFFLEFCTLQVV